VINSTPASVDNTIAVDAGATRATVPPLVRSTTDVLAQGRAPTSTVPQTTTTVGAASTSGDAPEPPSVEPGEAATLMDGVDVDTTLTRLNNELIITAGSLRMVVVGIADDGSVLELDDDGNIRLNQTRTLRVELSNLAVGATVDMWLFSDPTLLDSFVVGDDGAIKSRLAVSTQIPDGKHRLVVRQVTRTRSELVLAVGVVLGPESNGGSAIGWIIFPPLVLAAVAALVIPARRRRNTRAADAG